MHSPDTNGRTATVKHPRGAAAVLQNPLDRWLYHPLAARLARVLSHTPVTPNMVSVAGGSMVVIAGLAYIQPGWPLAVVAGLLCHMGWHVLDGADGDLARLTGKTSPTGEVIDGICDYVSHAILYVIMASAAFAVDGWLVWCAMLAGGLSRIVQTNFHEVHRRQFLWWAHGVPFLRTEPARGSGGAIGGAASLYLSVARWLAPGDKEIDDAMADVSLRDEMRAYLIDAGPATLAGSSLLGSNYRTLALGASMLAGSPMWYFLYEATVLNIVLALGVRRSRKTLAMLRKRVIPPTSR